MSEVTLYISRDTSKLPALPRPGEELHLLTLELPQEGRVMDTARVEVTTTGEEGEEALESREVDEVPAPAVRQTGGAGLRLTLGVRGRLWGG